MYEDGRVRYCTCLGIACAEEIVIMARTMQDLKRTTGRIRTRRSKDDIHGKHKGDNKSNENLEIITTSRGVCNFKKMDI